MSMYFGDYGRLAFLSRSDYFRGEWEYVCSSVSYDDDKEYDIVRNYDGSDWRYTSIQNNPERDFFFNNNYTQRHSVRAVTEYNSNIILLIRLSIIM